MTVAVAGGAKLANKQAARPAAPQMPRSSAALSSSAAAAAAPNVKVAAIKPPAPAQTYANDEAPLKLSIGEAPGMGESGCFVEREMRGRGMGASGKRELHCQMSLSKSSSSPPLFGRRTGLEETR